MPLAMHASKSNLALLLSILLLCGPWYSFANLHFVDYKSVFDLNLTNYPEESTAAVLFVVPENCDTCESHLKLLDDLSSDSFYQGDIYLLNFTIVPWISPVLSPPAVVFLNNKRKIPYLGPLHRTHFLNAMHQFTTGVQCARLDDDNFEHDTQATTGSTTGSWVIVFDLVDDARLRIYDGLQLSLRTKNINLGVVDPTISIRTAKRFKVAPHDASSYNSGHILLIMLHGSYMYRLPDSLHLSNYEKILNFALHTHQYNPKSKIPRPYMLFDEIVDNLVAYFMKLEAQNGQQFVFMLGIIGLFSIMGAIGLILVVVFWLAGSFGHHHDSRPVNFSTTSLHEIQPLTSMTPHEAGDSYKKNSKAKVE